MIYIHKIKVLFSYSCLSFFVCYGSERGDIAIHQPHEHDHFTPSPELRAKKEMSSGLKEADQSRDSLSKMDEAFPPTHPTKNPKAIILQEIMSLENDKMLVVKSLGDAPKKEESERLLISPYDKAIQDLKNLEETIPETTKEADVKAEIFKIIKQNFPQDDL